MNDKKDVIQSVVESLDGSNQTLLFPYLPYILQDLWELGSDPKTVIRLIRANIPERELRILDLGCGKGVVSVALAKELNCHVTGIDAMNEFIREASEYARVLGVSDRCKFIKGDIRKLISKYTGYDIIILGAIGSVFGNVFETLTIVKSSLNSGAYVILDDCYIDDDKITDYNKCQRKSEFYRQIKEAGFDIICEDIFPREQIEKTEEGLIKHIRKRIYELISNEPEKKELFLGYLKSQEYETEILKNVVTTGTWLLKDKGI